MSKQLNTINTIFEDMDSMLNNFFLPSFYFYKPITCFRSGLCDITEDKEKYQVVLDMPGIEKEDIKLIVKQGTLEIKAETEKRTFYKALKLDNSFDKNSISASYKNGVLTINIVKDKEEQEQEIKIE